MMRARLVNAEVKRVFETPRPRVQWDSFAVWSVISVWALLALSFIGYWLFRLADLAIDKLARLIP